MCRNAGKSRRKLLCKYHLFLLCGIRYLVVQRKIIRKVNDNDGGRAVMMFRRRCLVFAVVQALIRARFMFCWQTLKATVVSTISATFKVFGGEFGLHRRGFVYSGNWEGRMPVVLSGARYVSPALGRTVLIECAMAGRLSMAMMGKRRRCSM